MKILKEKDVVEMYREGYSVNYIIKQYYEYKNRNGVKNHYFKDNYIVTKKDYSMSYCSKRVYSILLQYNSSFLKS